MKKFILPPDSSAYSMADGAEIISTKLDGGASRVRKDIIGATSIVNCVWILGRDEYKYFRSFFRGITGKGANPFLIDLILDEHYLTEHEAYFVPNSVQLTGQKGHTYWLSAQLEVKPLPDLDNGDFSDIYSALGEDWYRWLDKLDFIVNHEWPEVL
jgi:hypothetical protein